MKKVFNVSQFFILGLLGFILFTVVGSALAMAEGGDLSEPPAASTSASSTRRPPPPPIKEDEAAFNARIDEIHRQIDEGKSQNPGKRNWAEDGPPPSSPASSYSHYGFTVPVKEAVSLPGPPPAASTLASSTRRPPPPLPGSVTPPLGASATVGASKKVASLPYGDSRHHYGLGTKEPDEEVEVDWDEIHRQIDEGKSQNPGKKNWAEQMFDLHEETVKNELPEEKAELERLREISRKRMSVSVSTQVGASRDTPKFLESGIGDKRSKIFRSIVDGDALKLKKLLGKDPGQINVINEQGDTPLHAAIGRWEKFPVQARSLIQILLNVGADLYEVKDASGKTAYRIFPNELNSMLSEAIESRARRFKLLIDQN